VQPRSGRQSGYAKPACSRFTPSGEVRSRGCYLANVRKICNGRWQAELQRFELHIAGSERASRRHLLARWKPVPIYGQSANECKDLPIGPSKWKNFTLKFIDPFFKKNGAGARNTCEDFRNEVSPKVWTESRWQVRHLRMIGPEKADLLTARPGGNQRGRNPSKMKRP
jgi:hypothetical protein